MSEKEKRKRDDWLRGVLQEWAANIERMVVEIVELQSLAEIQIEVEPLHMLNQSISQRKNMFLKELMRPALWLERGDYSFYSGYSPAQGLEQSSVDAAKIRAMIAWQSTAD